MSLYVLFINVDICVLCCRKVFKSRLNFPQDVVIDYEVGSGNKYTNIYVTSMYSLTLCVCVMLPERHQWKPEVEAASVMLRMLPVDLQSPASQPRPLPIYSAQF